MQGERKEREKISEKVMRESEKEVERESKEGGGQKE